MLEIKAVKLLEEKAIMKPGQGISCTVYDGTDILKADSVYNYARAMMIGGEHVPVPGYDVLLDIYSVEVEHYDENNRHVVIVEGILSE